MDFLHLSLFPRQVIPAWLLLAAVVTSHASLDYGGVKSLSQFVNDEAIEWQLEPNKKIGLRIKSRLSKGISGDLILSDFSCSPNPKQIRCTIAADFFNFDIELVWVEHPETARIGREVTLSKVGWSETLRFILFSNGILEKSLFAKLGLTSPTLTCENWSWLGKAQANEVVEIASITSEDSRRNDETAAFENQTVTELTQTKWVWSADRSALHLAAEGSHLNEKNQSQFLLDALFLGSTGSFTLIDSQNKLCQATHHSTYINNLQNAIGPEVVDLPVRADHPYLKSVPQIEKIVNQFVEFYGKGEVALQ